MNFLPHLHFEGMYRPQPSVLLSGANYLLAYWHRAKAKIAFDICYCSFASPFAWSEQAFEHLTS